MPQMGRFYYQVKADPRNDERFQHGDIVLIDPRGEIPRDSLLLLEESKNEMIIKQIDGDVPHDLEKKIVGLVIERYICP